MYNKEMYGLGSRRSVIRELFEFGKKRAAEIGDDKVFDFSLGNPSVPAPSEVSKAVEELIGNTESTLLHGYTSAQGDACVRDAIASNINERFDAGADKDFIYMTCGAAASLCISFRALNEGNDEFVVCAPYFPEYQVFISSAGGRTVTVPFRPEDFQPDLDSMEKAIGPKTKAVVINSPNNPCGVVYSPETVSAIASLLLRKSGEYGRPIFLISDEPYRELVYSDVEVPYVMNLYRNSIVCYSYSKSLSLPGERIGYIAVNPACDDAKGLYAAICGAGRALGYVCAPSLFQRVVAKCVGVKPDLDSYRSNRDILFGGLTEIGYECVRPDGAFYLFVKALESDASAFSLRARDYGLLIVPGDDFSAPGYVRLAYCVSEKTIRGSLPLFKELYNSYNEEK